MNPSWLGIFCFALTLSAADSSPQAEFEECQKRATAGDMRAQSELGWRHANGIGTPKDKSAAIIWFRKAAEKGHAEAQRNLGVALLLGDGTKEDKTAAVKWLSMAADQDDAISEYYLGHCYQHGVGVSKDIDLGLRWRYRAALNGCWIESSYTPSELASLDAWGEAHAASFKLMQAGELAKAYDSEKASLAVATEKLRDKRWPAIASSVRLLEIATKQKKWPQAYQHYLSAQDGTFNALADLIKTPAGIEIPEFITQIAKLHLKRKIAANNLMESIRLLDAQIDILQLEFGRGNIFQLSAVKERGEARMKHNQVQESDEDHALFVALSRQYLPENDESVVMALIGYAEHLGRRAMITEQASVLKEALDLEEKSRGTGKAYSSIKGKLLRVQVARRLQGGGELKPVSDLPATESELRKLADEGDPMACFRLSVGLSSGEFRQRNRIENAGRSPESKLYQDASVIPFFEETDSSTGRLNEKNARRLARLGHGFALYELSAQLTKQNMPWPPVGNRPGISLETEFTKESFDMLCQAAEAGVPAAINEVGNLLFYGSYDGQPWALREYDPFIGPGEHWYKRVRIPETNEIRLIRRLDDNPTIIRKDHARAAHFLLKDLMNGKDANAAYKLSLIYNRGATESHSGNPRKIKYPSIAPDKIESAAFLYVCLFSKDFDLISKDGVEILLRNHELTETERLSAQKRARELLGQRVRT
jgi:TPR repeat protein